MGKEEGFPVKKPHVQQKTERRISAALRLVLVAVLRKSSRPFELTRAELAKDWSLIKERL